MDPLSISVSIITILSISAQVSNNLAAIGEARGEVLSIFNEVTDLELVLRRIDSVITDLPAVLDSAKPELAALLERASAKLTELSSLVQKCLSRPPSMNSNNAPSVSRFRWMREASKAKALQKELRDVRSNLALMLAILNSKGLLRLEMVAQDVSLSMGGLRQGQQHLEHPISSGITGIQQQLAEISSSSNMQAMHIQQLSTSFTEGRSQTEALLRGVCGHLQSQIPRQDSSLAFQRHSHMRVSVSQYSCRAWCSCICHRTCHVQSPRFLNQVLGTLFIRYTGNPVARQACNEFSCNGRSSFSFRLSYYFPLWFLARGIITNISTKLEPTAGLRALRVRYTGDEIFTLTYNGDLSGIKSMFIQGLASPNDLTHADGYSLLTHAVSVSNTPQVGLIRFLLDQGADPNIPGFSGLSALDAAWEVILSGQRDAPTLEALRTIFADEDYLESRQFSILHKIVLGISKRSLREELDTSTAMINSVDEVGKTPLFWAARRGDQEAVVTLLEHGADPGIPDLTGRTPLHAACRANHATSINANDVVLNNNDNLEIVAACVRDLLRHGAEVEPPNPQSLSPLLYATRVDNVQSIALLLQHGADLYAPLAEGFSALPQAIYWNSHETLQVLIDHGVRPSNTLYENWNLLHVAARQGDLRTIQILSKGLPRLMENGLSDVDVEGKDYWGQTANEILYQRTEEGSELALAFEVLVTVVLAAKHSGLEIIQPNPKGSVLTPKSSFLPVKGVVETIREIGADEADGHVNESDDDFYAAEKEFLSSS